MSQQTSTPVTQRIVRATATVMAITLGVKLLGFVEKVILAYYFGTGMEVDAYLIAVSIPLMVFVLIREVIEPAFLPTFMGLIREGDEAAAWKLFRMAANGLLVLLTAASFLGVAVAPLLVTLLAPGFKGEQQVLTTQLVRVVVPAGLFLGLSALTYITHNSFKRFTIPALGDVAFKGLAIAVLFASFRFLGVFGMALGAVCGAAARLLVHFVGLWPKLKHHVFEFKLSYAPFRRMQRLMLPLVIGIVFSQLSLIVDNIFASTLQVGSVSALAYSKKLVEMPVIVLPYALSIIVFPFFSAMALSHRTEELLSLLLQTIRMLVFLFIPITVCLILLRDPVVKLLFQRGAFDSHSALLTSSATFYYSLGLCSYAVEAVLVQFYFSMSDTRTPIAVGILCVLLNIVMTLCLIGPLSHCGIALALAISKTVKIGVLYGLLKNRFENLGAAGLIAFLTKAGSAGLIMGVVITLISPHLAHLELMGPVGQLAHLVALALAGACAFVLVSFLLRLEEARSCCRFLRHSSRWLGLSSSRQAPGHNGSRRTDSGE